MKKNLAKIARSTAVIFFLGLSFLIILGVAWLIRIESFPAPAIPTPKMPAHNAFDSYVAASKLLVQPADVSAAASGTSVFTLTQKQAFVAANSAALAKLNQGLSQTYWNPPVRFFYAAEPNFQFRNLGHLLQLKAQVEAAQGQWQPSAASSLDAIQMGVAIQHGCPLIGALVGIGCESIGRRPFRQSIDHLSSAEAQADAARLEKIQADEVGLPDIYQQEEWAQQAGLLQMERSESRHKSFAGNVLFRSELYNYTRYMNQLIRDSRLPYAHRPPPPPVPHDFFTSIIAPVFAQSGEKYNDNITQNQLLIASLALRAYKADHGSYPVSLNQLAPAYLKAIPDDPFALSAPLRYRRVGVAYVLYSVGPDGKDDGGQPIVNHPSHYSERDKKVVADKVNYSVHSDSKGDIVAGLNT